MYKHRRNFTEDTTTNEDLSHLTTDLIRLWLLRALVDLNGFWRDGFHNKNDQISASLGVARILSPEDESSRKSMVFADLKKMRENLIRSANMTAYPGMLEQNAHRVAELLGLNRVEEQILAFAAIVHTHDAFNEIGGIFGNFTANSLYHAMAVMLGQPFKEIKDALSTKGRLARSGIVNVDRNGKFHLQMMLETVSCGFAEDMLHEDGDVMDVMKGILSPCDSACLSNEDFKYIRSSLETLALFLDKAYAEKRKGVNILIYGPPGTGKSQLARVLAEITGVRLYEVNRSDEHGDPAEAYVRLKSLRASQNILTNTRAMLLFDEIEDVFNDGGIFERSTADKNKGWINASLEENQTPTLWLSNSIDRMDPAAIRRFDMVLEVRVPPRSQRERIVRDSAGHLISDDLASLIAGAEQVTPAVIARASAVVSAVSEHLTIDEQQKSLVRIINSTLKAQGHKTLPKASAVRLPGWYDPRLINADADLESIADGLCESRSGRLCFYGPPGTGKTAFGRWLADRLEAPLQIKRVSDLISPWLGVSEMNIANAFEEAEQEGALLLIDEVDSFLQDRRNAVRSWEVTAVNEMLTQMESYSGVFIASTNLMDGLDQAALRRFDLKIRFGYLGKEQARAMLRNQCVELGLPEPDDMLNARLEKLGILTPGDFAAVTRQDRFRKLKSGRDVVEALEGECSVKEDGRRRAVGFV